MFFKKTIVEKKLKKWATVYISKLRGQIIVCPRYMNEAGILYEQENCTLLDFPLEPSKLGDEVLRNFNLFAFRDKNLRDLKLTDWPAFKCSKLKSVKSFENAFVRVDISGNNESDIILSIETQLAIDNDLNIQSTISASVSTETIGELIIKVYNKAQ